MQQIYGTSALTLTLPVPPSWLLLSVPSRYHHVQPRRQDLPQHARWLHLVRLEDVHPAEPVRKLLYLAHCDRVMSSSACPRNSLVVTHVERKKKTYVFRSNKVSAASCLLVWMGVRVCMRMCAYVCGCVGAWVRACARARVCGGLSAGAWRC